MGSEGDLNTQLTDSIEWLWIVNLDKLVVRRLNGCGRSWRLGGVKAI
jgi:hypothetical protein